MQATSDRNVWVFDANGLVCAATIDMEIQPRTSRFQTRGTPLLVAFDDDNGNDNDGGGGGGGSNIIVCVEGNQDRTKLPRLI